MPTPVLTDKATFQCAHGPPATTDAGITISAVATAVSIDGAHPILSGAMISGFNPPICPFMIAGVATPCVAFTLTPPSEAGVLIGQAVYTNADASSIALAVSSGNGIPGLTITESQTKVMA